jgi:GT2 family glycosyltransferase
VRLSVIVPSRTAGNFIQCMKAVRENEPDARLVLVDDGITYQTVACWEQFGGGPDVIVKGEKPFVFARNMNAGIAASGDADGYFLLNDDALLTTANGFSEIARLADERPEFGIIAPATNVTGALDQMPQKIGLREVRNIAFVCVYVPRRTLDSVGILDERFTSYGWEDTDYCHRVKQAGLKIGVYDHCFVDHGSLTSTFRGGPHSAGDIEPGRKIFAEKWGFAPA